MAQESDQLRQQIDNQRAEISGTVGEIENRVMPSRIAARGTDRVKHRMSGWRDNVFGADDDRSDHGNGASNGGMVDRASDMTSGAADSVRHAPQVARRETKGNPLAAGAIALGAGWLVAGLMPGSRQEKKLVERAEPKLADAASAAQAEGAALADELREPAQDAADDMQDTVRDSAQHVKDSSSTSS